MKKKKYIAPTITTLTMDADDLCDLTVTSHPAIHDINSIDNQGGTLSGGGGSWDGLAKEGMTYKKFEVWKDEVDF